MSLSISPVTDFPRWEPFHSFTVNKNETQELANHLESSIVQSYPPTMRNVSLYKFSTFLSDKIQFINKSQKHLQIVLNKRFSPKDVFNQPPCKDPFLPFWIHSKKIDAIKALIILPDTILDSDAKKIKRALKLTAIIENDNWIVNLFHHVLLRYKTNEDETYYLEISKNLKSNFKKKTNLIPTKIWGWKKAKTDQIDDYLEVSMPWVNRELRSVLIESSLPVQPYSTQSIEFPQNAFFQIFNQLLSFTSKLPADVTYLDITSSNYLIRTAPIHRENKTYQKWGFYGYLIDPDLMTNIFERIWPSYYLPWDCFAMSGYALVPDVTSLAMILAEALYGIEYLKISANFTIEFLQKRSPRLFREIIDHKINLMDQFSQVFQKIEANLLSKIFSRYNLQTPRLDKGNNNTLTQFMKTYSVSITIDDLSSLSEILLLRRLHNLIQNTLADNLLLFFQFLLDDELENCFYIADEQLQKTQKIQRLSSLQKFRMFELFRRQQISYFANKYHHVFQEKKTFENTINNKVQKDSIAVNIVSSLFIAAQEEKIALERVNNIYSLIPKDIIDKRLRKGVFVT